MPATDPLPAEPPPGGRPPDLSPGAFLPLFLAAEPDLRAFVGSLVAEPAAREDLFQEVAVTLWECFERFDPERGAFGAWARGVAANKVLHARRRSGRLPVSFPPEAIAQIAEAFGADPDEELGGARAEALRDCLRRLPERSRKLVELRYEEGLSGRQLAGHLGRSIDAVYQSLSRIRRGLEECIRGRLGKPADVHPNR